MAGGKASAHVYISGSGGAALRNHTDTTDIVVHQLAGAKEWLLCQAAHSPPAVRDKLSSCSQFGVEEMALVTAGNDCSRLITEPGDTLFLPRGIVHSARAVGAEVSVHITVGLPKCLNRRNLQANAHGDLSLIHI